MIISIINGMESEQFIKQDLPQICCAKCEVELE